MNRRRLLGVFAHPDDEVFCAGGTLAVYSERGAETMVVSATRGESGQIRDASAASRATLGQVRENELRAACAELGVTHVSLLDYRDGTLASVDRSQLADEVAQVLADFKPDVVVTFGPDGMYGHPDHVAISDVTHEAFLRNPQGRLFFSHFTNNPLLLVDRLSEWLTHLTDRFKGPDDFALAFSLFAQETNKVGFASDHLEVQLFAPGSYIVEQGEESNTLFLILSGDVEVRQDQPNGRSVVIRRQGPGQFFGELGVAKRARRSANVIAIGVVTCLVFSRGSATAFAPRGSGGTLAALTVDQSDDAPAAAATVIDVSSVIGRKIRAIAAHRTQYPIDPAMFPEWMVVEMMGQEKFIRAYPPNKPEIDLFK